MALSNAERQARWRTRRTAELEALRQSAPQNVPANTEEPIELLRRLSRDVTDDGEFASLLLDGIGDERMLEIAPRFFRQLWHDDEIPGKSPLPKLAEALLKYKGPVDGFDRFRERKALARSCLRALQISIDMLLPKRSRFEQWDDHVEALRELQQDMESSLDSLPDNFRDGEQGDRLQAYIDVDLSGLDDVT